MLEKRVVIVDGVLVVVSLGFVGGVLDMVAMLSRDCRDCKAIGSGFDGLYVLSSGWNRRGFEVWLLRIQSLGIATITSGRY